MTIRWRGRVRTWEMQVANAHDDTKDLTPASATLAATVKTRWSALSTGQAIPLIGERGYDYGEEDPELRD